MSQEDVAICLMCKFLILICLARCLEEEDSRTAAVVAHLLLVLPALTTSIEPSMTDIAS